MFHVLQFSMHVSVELLKPYTDGGGISDQFRSVSQNEHVLCVIWLSSAFYYFISHLYAILDKFSMVQMVKTIDATCKKNKSGKLPKLVMSFRHSHMILHHASSRVWPLHHWALLQSLPEPPLTHLATIKRQSALLYAAVHQVTTDSHYSYFRLGSGTGVMTSVQIK